MQPALFVGLLPDAWLIAEERALLCFQCKLHAMCLTPLMRTEGRPIPTELRREEAQLRHDIELEDDNTAVCGSHGHPVGAFVAVQLHCKIAHVVADHRS